MNYLHTFFKLFSYRLLKAYETKKSE